MSDAGESNTILPLAPSSESIAVVDVELDSQLEQEQARKSSIEQRGITIITSSGVIVTLLFAVTSLVTKSHTIKNFSSSEGNFLLASLVAFLAAAIVGLGVNIPLRFGTLEATAFWEDFKMVTRPRSSSAEPGSVGSGDSESEWVRNQPQEFRLKYRVVIKKYEMLRRNQRLNLWKAEGLLLGFALEVAGMAALTVALFLVVNQALA